MKNKIGSILLLFALLTALLPSYDASAQGSPITVEIQPDGDSMKDATIQYSPDNNYGSSGSIGVGEYNAGTNKQRALLEFDLSGLPYDMLVQSATLILTVKNDYSDNTRTMNAYAINTEWTESQVKWAYKQTGVPWQTAGAEGSDDVITEPIGSVSVADNLAPGATVSITLSNDAVQAMRLQNLFGIKLQMETENNDMYDFYSSDDATATNRPKLIIEYIPDPEFEIPDTKWICVNVAPYAGCTELDLNSEESPYNHSGLDTGGVEYGAAVRRNPQSAAKLLCDPYPRCVNDYPIYYRLTYIGVWSAGGSTNGTLSMTLDVPGGADVFNSVPCGVGTSGYCRGVFEGEISIYDLPPNYDGGFTIGLDTGFSFPSGYFVFSPAISWTLYLSLKPFDQDCAETWYVPVPDTYEIDPTLETPLGQLGTPADYQIYPTEIGQVYMVRVEDGPWNDGTDDRIDAAVSFDGEEWMTWEEFSVDAICIDVSAASPEDDYRIIYFEATTEEFHIRVNDEAAAFADNTNDPETPYQYVIGIAFALAGPVSCEAQFAYDPVNDTIASVTVPATSEDVAANNEMTEPIEPGGWYGIEVASGSWNENSPTTPRTDIEFSFTSGVIGANVDWQDLGEGSNLVYCVSSDGATVFVQAPAGDELVLHLRVNDQDTPQNFADNSGSLGVNIYKTTFTRQVDGCELQFDIGSFVYHDEVAGNASSGKIFATVFSSEDLTYSYGLTPGGWYMLETTDGPWWQTFTGGGYNAHEHYYDMQVKNNNGDWTDFDTWNLAECVVTVDALGHQRIYFQTPDVGGDVYYLKVGGAGPFGRGSMGWDLYQAADIGLSETVDCQDYVYDPEVASGFGSIDAELANGAPIIGLGTWEFYAIHIESANTASDPPYYQDSGWFESEGADERDDLELTIDGTNWSDLPNHPAVLCYYYTPESEELVFFVRVLNNQTWKMRANSTTFSDNLGTEYYRVYQATGGDNLDPWTSCADDYQATVPAINEHEWIPPQDEEGVMLMPTLTYTPEADPDGDGVIIWGNPGLESGHFYMVEIKDGPWYDQLPKVDGSYLAQLSSDGGVTWELFNEHPDVMCYTQDQTHRYWKAIFEVTEGQQWKIRVADTETEVFTDNSGNLAYRLTLVNEFPVDGPGSVATDYDPGAADVCEQALVRPQTLTLSEIGSLGNYFGDWIQYINRSVLQYFAWCPRHTDLLLSAMNALKNKEPLATLAELNTVQKNIKTEVDSYDWDDGGYQDTSIFNADSTADVNRIFDNVIPQSGEGVSPWEDGGNLVNFDGGNNALPAYYSTCNSVFADYLPSRMRIGVCFASAYWKETGASFWVQLSLDLSALGLLFVMIKGALQSLVYMMTGVRPWTKDGASKMIVEIASGSELIQPVDKWRSRR